LEYAVKCDIFDSQTRNILRGITLILFAMLAIPGIHAQKATLIVNAGPDTCCCRSSQTQLGGSPTVTGGVEPYTYIWYGYYVIYPGLIYQTASDILDDTTAANPYFIGTSGSIAGYTIGLDVVDAVGNYGTDAVTVTSAGNYECLLWIPDETINPGDSVQLGSVCDGGIAPYTYLWTPSSGLTDPTAVNTYASPLHTTTYHLEEWDACHCALSENGGSSSVIVRVTTTGTEETRIHPSIILSPNPASGFIEARSSEELKDVHLVFLDFSGKEILDLETVTNKKTDISHFAGGIYLVRIYSERHFIGTERLVVY
jgi:hypothetical protein